MNYQTVKNFTKTAFKPKSLSVVKTKKKMKPSAYIVEQVR